MSKRRNRTPVLLDLFCGVGGAAMGYHRAGFKVVGVDIEWQEWYPTEFEFIQADALKLPRTLTSKRFDAIHASPPCLRWSDATGTRQIDSPHPDLITPTRELLLNWNLPYVIENVRNAPLKHPSFICGTRLRLRTTVNGVEYRLRRHRYFETNWTLITPGCGCGRDPRPVMDVTGGGSRAQHEGKTFRGGAQDRRNIMGIQWAPRDSLKDAIPPAYTELIGRQLMNVVTQRRA